METILTTNDNKTVIIRHDQSFSDAELENMKEMTIHELYHVGKIRGITLED